MEKYIDKNNSFKTDGNEDADIIFCMMENNTSISDQMKYRINNLALWIVTNHENHVDKIRQSIKDLKDEMEWMIIFSDKFIYEINSLLLKSLIFEIEKISKK